MTELLFSLFLILMLSFMAGALLAGLGRVRRAFQRDAQSIAEFQHRQEVLR